MGQLSAIGKVVLGPALWTASVFLVAEIDAHWGVAEHEAQQRLQLGIEVAACSATLGAGLEGQRQPRTTEAVCGPAPALCWADLPEDASVVRRGGRVRPADRIAEARAPTLSCAPPHRDTYSVARRVL